MNRIERVRATKSMNARRTAVRSIDWLDVRVRFIYERRALGSAKHAVQKLAAGPCNLRRCPSKVTI